MSTPTMAAFPVSMQVGAADYLSLVERIRDINDATCHRFGEDIDGRDYVAIARDVESSLRKAMTCDDALYREGFLRAMAERLSLAADGCGPGFEPRPPLEITEAAFVREKLR